MSRTIKSSVDLSDLPPRLSKKMSDGVDWQILSDCRHDPQDEEDSYIRFTDDMRKRRLKKFRAKAIKALQRIKGDDSELRDLWEENEELYPKWIGNIDRIMKRLGK